MADPLEQALYDFMYDNGVDSSVAHTAANNCARAVERNGAAGFAAGTALGVLTANPSALLMGGVAGAGAGIMTLGLSPHCEEVREAANRWADGSVNELQ